jgi:hypothetical protein
MDDWPPSAPDEDHEITYVIVDLRGEVGVGPPYRVSVVNGDRLMYEAESVLVADLDTIEARRCAGCTPARTKRRDSASRAFQLGGVL